MAGESGRQGFRDLIVWQKAMNLVTEIYNSTRSWPRDEQFGLISQIRRAATSIPSNIAEGHGRTGSKEFLPQLSIAYGSLCEVETQLDLAARLDYIDDQTSAGLLANLSEVRKLLNGLLRSLQSKM